MLILSRRTEESIIIAGEVEIRILSVRGSGARAVVRIGVSAPREVPVHRKEVYLAVVRENRRAAALPAFDWQALMRTARSARSRWTKQAKEGD